ncbi:MAG: type II toxin-antitoxin system prevent-host-death family antitoxin [Acidobacteria bacterium]|nr:type II toxin-antitoxin system prevent-host-death family antitoxin [Acidobacteriota bacterium]MCA1639565.1 type II toxin-antitoxin system prevent-host-death family antitoxin [Acidobacteriota bacterium]
MRTTNIAELKNHLSSFLADVKRGEEILISDRNQPIAKIVPLHNTSDFSAEELALAAAGILRLPEESEASESFLKEKRSTLKSETVIKAIIDERDED